MKEILIINLTRMGDLLQTTPLMAGLKEKYQGVRITLLVSTKFAEICSGIPFVDDLIEFNMHGFRDRLIREESDIVGNYLILKELINRINEKEYDLAINLTHSAVSALIMSLIHAHETRGFTIDSEGHRVIRHPWLRYFFNVVPNRDYNPFHLVDMYLKAGDVKPARKGLIYEVREEHRIKAEATLLRHGIRKGDILVGIHLGASKSDKTWPVGSFAEVAGMISRDYSARIILFGSASEAELGDQFTKAAACNTTDLIGKTALGELSALLKRCSVLISNDTGPLHLATAVGTKVVDIFTANVHFLETSPYGEGHYVIQSELPCVPCGFDVQCNDRKCKETITPQIVFDTVKMILDSEPAHTLCVPGDVQVYRTYFRETGMLGFQPLGRKVITREVLYRDMYRAVWDMDSHIKTGSRDELYGNMFNELLPSYIFDHSWNLVYALREDAKALASINQLAGQGGMISQRICDETAREHMDLRLLKELSDSLDCIAREIELQGHVNPCLRPLTVVFAFSLEALEGDGLSALAESSRKIYEDLIHRSSLFMTVMKNILSFIEPKLELAGKTVMDAVHENECKGCVR